MFLEVHDEKYSDHENICRISSRSRGQEEPTSFQFWLVFTDMIYIYIYICMKIVSFQNVWLFMGP